MDKLRPNDSRVESKTASVRGKTYHYYLANNSGSSAPRDTILLLHGFPDMGFGWRYQIPLLVSLNLRVIVPDLLGYGRTNAPTDLVPYSLRSMADDMIELVDRIVPSPSGSPQKFLIGGHDWGAGLGYRVCLWHPDRVKGYFAVCVPYTPPSGPSKPFVPIEDMVVILPNFGYQKQLAGSEIVEGVKTPGQIRDWLNCVYSLTKPRRASSPRKEDKGLKTKRPRLFEAEKGWNLALLAGMKPSPLISMEEMNFYVQEYSRHGMQGPTNWYRTRRLNYDDECELVKAKGEGVSRLEMPVLFVGATHDPALPPSMAKGMEKHFDRLRIDWVDCGHWALWESAPELNEIIKNWLEDEFLGPTKASL